MKARSDSEDSARRGEQKVIVHHINLIANTTHDNDSTNGTRSR